MSSRLALTSDPRDASKVKKLSELVTDKDAKDKPPEVSEPSEPCNDLFH